MSILDYTHRMAVTGCPVIPNRMPIDMSFPSAFYSMQATASSIDADPRSFSHPSVISGMPESGASHIQHPSHLLSPPLTTLHRPGFPVDGPGSEIFTQSHEISRVPPSSSSSFSPPPSPHSPQYSQTHTHARSPPRFTFDLSNSFPPTSSHARRYFHQQLDNPNHVMPGGQQEVPSVSTPTVTPERDLERAISPKSHRLNSKTSSTAAVENGATSGSEKARLERFPPAKRFIRSLASSPLEEDDATENAIDAQDKIREDISPITESRHDNVDDNAANAERQLQEDKDFAFSTNTATPISIQKPCLSAMSPSAISSSATELFQSSLFPMSFMTSHPLFNPTPESALPFIKRRHSANVGGPIVVDSSIPFTTYLQNLTLTLQQSASASRSARSASSSGPSFSRPLREEEEGGEGTDERHRLARQNPDSKNNFETDESSRGSPHDISRQDPEEPGPKLRSRSRTYVNVNEDEDGDQDDDDDDKDVCIESNGEEEEEEEGEEEEEEEDEDEDDEGREGRSTDQERSIAEHIRAKGRPKRRRYLSDVSDQSSTPLANLYMQDAHQLRIKSGAVRERYSVSLPLPASILTSSAFPIYPDSSVINQTHMPSPHSYHPRHYHQQQLQQQQHDHHHHPRHHPMSPPHGLSALPIASLTSPRPGREQHPHLPVSPAVQFPSLYSKLFPPFGPTAHLGLSNSLPSTVHTLGGLSSSPNRLNSLFHPSFLTLGNHLGMRRTSTEKPPPVKKYKCDVCQKAFSRSNTLVTHKRIHTGDKPFKCEICGRAFRQPGNLTRHRLTHTTHKPYVCHVCNKAFNRASNLNTHIRTHSSFRQFGCPSNGSAKNFHIPSHVYPHHGERLFKCDVCGRGFAHSSTLATHRRTHTATDSKV